MLPLPDGPLKEQLELGQQRDRVRLRFIHVSGYALNSGKSHHHLVKKVRDRR